MDQIGRFPANNGTHSLRQACFEILGNRIHSEIQIRYLTAPVIGVIGRFIDVGGVGKVDNGSNTGVSCRLIRVGTASDGRVNGGRRAIQFAGTHARGIDHTEVGEGLVAQVGIVRALNAANELMNEPLIAIAAFLLHGDFDFNGSLYQIIPFVAGLFLYGALRCNSVGGGEIAHVDSQNQRTIVRSGAQDGNAIVNVAVV